MAVTHRVVVWLFLDELRRHIQRSPLDGGQHHRVAGHGPGKAKVTQLDHPIGPDQDILGLHVSVDDAVGMQVVQSPDQLLCHLLHHLLRQVSIILQDFKQLPCIWAAPVSDGQIFNDACLRPVLIDTS